MKDRTLNANIIKKNIQNTVLDAESIFDQQVAWPCSDNGIMLHKWWGNITVMIPWSEKSMNRITLVALKIKTFFLFYLKMIFYSKPLIRLIPLPGHGLCVAVLNLPYNLYFLHVINEKCQELEQCTRYAFRS